MRATISNVNIRGCEPKEGKGGAYLLVRFEDETGKPYSLVDKDMERQKSYRRDMVGTLIVDIDMGKYTNIRIKNFIPDQKEDSNAGAI